MAKLLCIKNQQNGFSLLTLALGLKLFELISNRLFVHSNSNLRLKTVLKQMIRLENKMYSTRHDCSFFHFSFHFLSNTKSSIFKLTHKIPFQISLVIITGSKEAFLNRPYQIIAHQTDIAFLQAMLICKFQDLFFLLHAR